MSKFRDYSNYEIYADGRIWSYKSNKFLKPAISNKGYKVVVLTDNEGKRKMYLLHRVVWESFTGKPIPLGMQINHRNEIKTDNRFFENLELVTPKENINWGSRNARDAKSKSKQVGAFKDGELIMVFPSTAECGRQGFNQGNVAACCRGERNTHKGFEWRYI